MAEIPIITIMTLTPLVGALLVMALRTDRAAVARGVGLVFSLLTLVLAGIVWVQFDTGITGIQFVERHEWIPSIKVDYHVGVDGLGLLMVLLSALITPFALLASTMPLKNPRAYVALFLFLEAGLMGAFTALNFFHWFLFWELSLVPGYFLVKLWGGPGRVKAATQFFIYTMVGSIAMLLGFMAVYMATGSLDFLELADKAKGLRGGLTSFFSVELGWYDLSDQGLAMIIFLLILLGFAVKVPLFPFHTWLPATYAEAPTPVSMVLTGAMSKMGVYGFLRIILPIFPEQLRTVQTPLICLAVATIVMGALAALAQKDLKRMMAYSSVNHLGYCLLGIFAAVSLTDDPLTGAVEKAAVLNGVLLQMFNHGICAAALFWFIGRIEQRSGGLRGIDDFGGLRQVAPVFCGLMGVALFASLGLPGLNGFVGEFLIFKGAFPLAPWATGLSVIGLLVTAVFLLTILQRVFHGPLNDTWSQFKDLTMGERLVIIPATFLMFFIGLYPQAVLNLINPSMTALVGYLDY